MTGRTQIGYHGCVKNKTGLAPDAATSQSRADRSRIPNSHLFPVVAFCRGFFRRTTYDLCRRSFRRAAYNCCLCSGGTAHAAQRDPGCRPNRIRHKRRKRTRSARPSSAAHCNGTAPPAATHRDGPDHRADQPVAAHTHRLRPARHDEPARHRAGRMVFQAPRLHRAHRPAQQPLPLLHRRTDRKTRHAERNRAAAHHRKRLQPRRLLPRARVGHLAVHTVDRQALRAAAEFLVRRPARRHGGHQRGARLPRKALRNVRQLGSGTRVL